MNRPNTSLKTIAIGLLILLNAQIATAQTLEWLNGTALFGMFPREKCKRLKSLSYVDECRDHKPKQSLYWRQERTVDFDTIGRPIRLIEKDLEFGEDHFADHAMLYTPEGCMNLYLSFDVGVAPTISSSYQSYCHDGRLDSLRFDFFGRENHVTWMVYDNAGRVKKMIERTAAFPTESRAWVRFDTTIYEYDSLGRMILLRVRDNRPIEIHYFGQDSLQFTPIFEDKRQVTARFNAQGLPETMTQTLWRWRWRRWRVSSEMTFRYDYR